MGLLKHQAVVGEHPKQVPLLCALEAGDVTALAKIVAEKPELCNLPCGLVRGRPTRLSLQMPCTTQDQPGVEEA